MELRNKKLHQYAFDIGASLLMRQFGTSKLGSRCALRGRNNQMCFWGPWFNQEAAKNLDNKCGIGVLNDALMGMGFELRFIEDARKCHDSSAPMYWVSRLRRIAKEYNLKTDTLDKYAKRYDRAAVHWGNLD